MRRAAGAGRRPPGARGMWGGQAAKADEAMRPLMILQLKEGSSEVDIIRENLEAISGSLRASGADVVSIVSVMGAYRTGKSFLLDLLLRYLRRRIALQNAEEERQAALKAAAAADGGQVPEATMPAEEAREEPEAEVKPESLPWTLGDDSAPRRAPPQWLLEGDATRISEGSKTDGKEGGFAWRPGKDKCTQGIWLWSKPFVFTDQAGKKIGVLLMDTQGAWDDTMTKAQSATIFGLTALLSSKLVYNIQNRIEEDKLENLDYITTFAQTVCSELPGNDAPFGHLEILVRDWANFEDGFSLQECLGQMREHQDDHLNPEKVPEDARPRVERLASTFRSINSFGLPHPGLKVTKPAYAGELSHIDGDFIHLLDVFVSSFFGGEFPRPSAPMGMEITVGSFQQVVMNFAEAFRENAAEMAIGLREAFVKVEMMTAKEDLLKRFRESLGRIAPESAVVEPAMLKREADKITASFKAEFENKLKPWRLKDSEEFAAIQEFSKTISEAASMRVYQNDQQVEGATMKLVASPVVGCGAYFLLVHQWIAACFLGVGMYFHAKKWSARNSVDMVDPSVFSGIWEDVQKWFAQRWKDFQAIKVALNRCNPSDAMETIMKASRQAGAMAVTAVQQMPAAPTGTSGAASSAAPK